MSTQTLPRTPKPTTRAARPRPTELPPPVAPAPALPPLGTEPSPIQLRARGEALLRLLPDADALAGYPPGFERRGAALSALAQRPAVDELGRAVTAAFAPLYERLEASGGVLDERAALDRRVLDAARGLHHEASRRVAAAEVAVSGNLPQCAAVARDRLATEIAAQELRRDTAQQVLTRAAQQERSARKLHWLNLRTTPSHKLDRARAELADALQRLAALHATRDRLNAAIASAPWRALESSTID